MKIELSEGYTFDVSLDALDKDLREEHPDARGFVLEPDGSLAVRFPGGYEELYVARKPDEGTSNSMWGDLPGGYEFCGSRHV